MTDQPSDHPDTALRALTRATLAHYETHADSFWQSTRDHDVSQNIAALLRHIRATPPFTILDFGCGPGRDLKRLSEAGHIAVGLEGAARFADMARQHSGCEVLHQDFLALDLPPARFDGIFANASLFHVPSAALAAVLAALRASLKADGVLFCSNPRAAEGKGLQEGWSGDRYGAYYDFETWCRRLQRAGFSLIEHYYRPDGLPRDQQPWLATVWRSTCDTLGDPSGDTTG